MATTEARSLGEVRGNESSQRGSTMAHTIHNENAPLNSSLSQQSTSVDTRGNIHQQSSFVQNKSSFHALYTKQKTQKRKVWHDGRLSLSASTATLYPDDSTPGASREALDACSDLLPSQVAAIRNGSLDTLETEKYLIQINEPWVSSTPTYTKLSKPVSQSMQKLFRSKFRKPAFKPPPRDGPHPPSFLQNRKRPLQPGELYQKHYGHPQQMQPPQYQLHPPHRHYQQQQQVSQPGGPANSFSSRGQEYPQQQSYSQSQPPHQVSAVGSHVGYSQPSQQQSWGSSSNDISSAPPSDAMDRREMTNNANLGSVNQQGYMASTQHYPHQGGGFPSVPAQQHDQQQHQQAQPQNTGNLAGRAFRQAAANAGFNPHDFYGEEEEEEEEDGGDTSAGETVQESLFSFSNQKQPQQQQQSSNHRSTSELLSLFGSQESVVGESDAGSQSVASNRGPRQSQPDSEQSSSRKPEGGDFQLPDDISDDSSNDGS